MIVATAVLLTLGLVIAWSVLIPGFMDWDGMVVAVIGSLRLTGPVAAIFTAWVALRKRRADRGRALTPWRAARTPLGIITVVVCSFAVTVLLLGLRAALADQSGHLPTGGLAMCAAGLTLYVMIGWITGWVLPFAATPVIAGIGTYGLFTWLATGWTWADRLTPTARRPHDLFAGAGEAAFTNQTLWLLGLSTALLLGWVALVTRRTLALVAAVIATVAAGAGAIRLVAEPHTVAATERIAYCQSWPITVCVRPAMRDALAELTGVFTPIARRLLGTPGAFDRVEQRDRDDQSPVPPGVAAVHLDGTLAGYAQRAATEFLDRLARPCPGTISNGYRAIVIAWLRGAPLPSGTLPEHRYAAVWFSGLTEEQRHNWLRMFYSDFVSCRLQSRHFGGGTRPADPNLVAYPVNPTPAYAPAQPVNPAYPVSPGPVLDQEPDAARPPRPRLSPKPLATPGLSPQARPPASPDPTPRASRASEPREPKPRADGGSNRTAASPGSRPDRPSGGNLGNGAGSANTATRVPRPIRSPEARPRSGPAPKPATGDVGSAPDSTPDAGSATDSDAGRPRIGLLDGLSGEVRPED